MRSLTSLLFAIPLAALSLAFAPDAAACGACFHGEMENTQVTGHKMIFSISPTETTLWDQFQYVGDPSSFAWVLPIKGNVDIGLSSDALFEQLNQSSQVTVEPPPINCPPPPSCWNGSASASSSGGLGFDAGSVTVTSQKVVGPFETVTLHSTDPNALADWLTTNGYVIPQGFAPVISAYVSEGFDFLALKLIPGQDVKAMRPVRVSMAGAGASLPLRMIAAGVGVTTPITLWVFGQGRYEPTNFPSFVIAPDQLVWDFATSSSNYKTLRQAGFDAANGKSWLVETSRAFSSYEVSQPLQYLTMVDPAGSGYADDNGMGAPEALAADLDKLWGNIGATSLWLTRLYAELPRPALATDLTIGAAASQAQVPGNLTAKKGVNIPECPTYPPCPDTSSSSGGTSTGNGGAGGAGGSGGSGGTPGGGSSSGCNVGGVSQPPLAIGALVAALGLGLARRRRSKKR
ncbi:MAG: DUF2330 domain-containing protein [Minicystis sp.]